MPKGIRNCKICGKAYEYCHTMRSNPEMFRWQDVACCPEHGAQYLALVLEARGQKQPIVSDAVVSPAEEAPMKKIRKKKQEPAEPVEAEEMA